MSLCWDDSIRADFQAARKRQDTVKDTLSLAIQEAERDRDQWLARYRALITERDCLAHDAHVWRERHRRVARLSAWLVVAAGIAGFLAGVATWWL